MMNGERRLLITSALLSKRSQHNPAREAVRDVLAAAKAVLSNVDLTIEINTAKRRGDWQRACSLVLDSALHKIKAEMEQQRRAGKKSFDSYGLDRIMADESGRLCNMLVEIYQSGACGKSLQDWKKFVKETSDIITAGLTEVLFEEGDERISFVRLTTDELGHVGALWVIAESRAEVEVKRLESNEIAVERLRRARLS